MMDVCAPCLTSSEYIFNLSMKQVHSNPSRSELLTWFNSHLHELLPPIKKIEDLGNGAAYLYMLVILRPGTVRSDKIIKFPSNHHEFFHNLKLLAAALEKLQLSFKIEPQKLAQMKYQENYYLSCFLYKNLTAKGDQPDHPTTETKENSNQSNRLKRIKVVAPERPISLQLQKEQRPTVTKEDLEDFQSSSGVKLKKIEVIMRESKTNKEKLDKIAAILNLNHSKHHQSTATMTIDSTSNNPLSIQASYKRFLRPSICQQSSFLNKSKPVSFEKGKVEVSPARIVEHVCGKEETIQPSNEFQGEMLLSQRKEAENEKQEELSSIVPSFGGETATEEEKGVPSEHQQLYPLI